MVETVITRACSSMAEHQPFKLRVEGSNPSGLTKKEINLVCWGSAACGLS